MDKPKILAVIPARGGSKGVPKKNIKNLAGKPLIAWTIITALDVKDLLLNIVVSTDDVEIAKIAKKYGAEVPFIRPEKLSTDESPTIPVLQHAVNYVENNNNMTFDWVLLLQPTAPLRRTIDIRNAIEIALNNSCDSVISVNQVFSTHPILMKKINNNILLPYCIKEKEGMRRQDYFPEAYIRNGAIYLTKRNVLMMKNSIWGDKIRPLIMEENHSTNIDNQIDYYVCEKIMKERLNNKNNN